MVEAVRAQPKEGSGLCVDLEGFLTHNNIFEDKAAQEDLPQRHGLPVSAVSGEVDIQHVAARDGSLFSSCTEA